MEQSPYQPSLSFGWRRQCHPSSSCTRVGMEMQSLRWQSQSLRYSRTYLGNTVHYPNESRISLMVITHRTTMGYLLCLRGERCHLPSIGKLSSLSTLMVPSVLGGPCCSLVPLCTACASALPQRSICHPSFDYFLGQLESQGRRHDRQ